MAAKGLSVVIAAEDRATGVLNKVNTGLENFARRTVAASAPGDRFANTMARIGQNTGLAQAGQDMGRFAQQSLRAAQSLGRFAPSVGALAGAGSVAGLAAMTTRWADYGAELQRTAARAGLSAERLQALQGATRLMGGTAEAATEGLTTLQDGLTNAVSGRAPEVVMMLQSLGIAFTGAGGGARNAMEVLPQVADKIAALRDPTLQARAATALFGGAAASMLPLLRRGSAGLSVYTAEAKRYGAINDDGAEAARRFGEAQTRLGLAAEGVTYRIASGLAPAMVPLMDKLAAYTASHGNDIEKWFGKIGTQLDHWASSNGPEKLLTSLDRMGTSIGGAVTTFGGLGQIAQDTLVFFAGRWVIGMVASIEKVTAAFGAAKAASMLGKAGAVGQAGLLGYLGWEGINAAGAATSGLAGDAGLARLLHNMLFDANPLHWTQSYGATSPGGWFGRQVQTGSGGRFQPSAGAGLPPGPVPPMGPVTLSSYNNNNPTNLAYHPAQRGVMGANGRWGVYQTPEAGTAAGLDQMLRDAEQKGFRTLADEIQHRSPPNENNTLGMIRDIAGWSGIKPDEELNLRDPDRAQRFLTAVIRREQGRTPDPEMVRRAVGISLGTGPAGPAAVAPVPVRPPLAPPVATVPPPGTGAPTGSTGPNAASDNPTAHVRFSFQNAPDGLRTQVMNTGGGLRIEMPALGGGAAP